MEQVVAHEDPSSFRARAADFLAAREAEHNLVLGLLSGIEQGHYTEQTLWTVERDGEVVLAALRTPPHNIVLSRGDEGSVRALADACRGIALPGVNGLEPEVDWFAGVWGGGRLIRREGVYAARAVSAPEGVEGAARDPRPEDLPLLAEWIVAFQHEVDTPTGILDEAGARAWVERRIANAGLVLWEAGDEPVAMAGSSGPTPTGIRIGPVYTPPGHRRRGFAGAVTAEASARHLAAGKRWCFLYTDLANPTSNGVYARIGYRRVAEAAVYAFDA